MESKDLSSNWKKLKISGSLKRKREMDNTASVEIYSDLRFKKSRTSQMDSRNSQQAPSYNAHHLKETPVIATKSIPVSQENEGLSSTAEIGKYLALDCEMVGIGPQPDDESALARVSIVNFNGDQVYDSYVKPKEQVTDWRTHVSGITPRHMINARSLETVQADVTKILKNKVVIGHAIRYDFNALLLSHPKRDIRDTARHPAYRDLAGGSSPRLKMLASQLLGLEIQTGEHSSVEDARACMLLFRKDKDAFEREHAKKWTNQRFSNLSEDVQRKPTKTRKKSNRRKK